MTETPTRTVKTITNKVKSLIHYAALGHTARELSEILSYTPTRVCQILKDSKVQAMIETKRHQLFHNNIEARLNKTALKAFDTAESLMLNESVKDGVRLSAAKDFMDRALGKAIQRIDNTGTSSIRDLFEALDRAGISLKEKDPISPQSEPIPVSAEPLNNHQTPKSSYSPLDTSTEVDNLLETL